MMRKFVFNGLLFLAITVLVLHVRPLYLLINNAYQRCIEGVEVYTAINKSKKKNKSKKIIIGDSVGNQLFWNEIITDTLNSMATNQSVSMAGQYFILKNYFETGNRPDTVYLIYSPASFSNNLDEKYTYQNFAKPFYKEEFIPLMDSIVLTQVNKLSYLFALRWPIVYTSNWSPLYQSKDKRNYTWLSPITINYLNKMKQLTYNYSAKLIIIPPLVSDVQRSSITKMRSNEEVDVRNFPELKNYFLQIKYLPDSLFIDGSHFKEPARYKAAYQRLFQI